MTGVRLSVAVQHHPGRAHLLPRLLERLAPIVPDVVADPDPGARVRSPWRTYREALRLTPSWATHRLVLQDDVEVCRDFADACRAALEHRPASVVAFFVAGQPVEQARAVRAACAQGWGWADLDPSRWVPAIATCWPARHCQPCVSWADAQGWPEEFYADDEIIGRYLRHAGELPLATVPSLVEHPDVEPSLISDRARAGADPDRVAACWIGDCHHSNVDWTAGPA